MQQHELFTTRLRQILLVFCSFLWFSMRWLSVVFGIIDMDAFIDDTFHSTDIVYFILLFV